MQTRKLNIIEINSAMMLTITAVMHNSRMDSLLCVAWKTNSFGFINKIQNACSVMRDPGNFVIFNRLMYCHCFEIHVKAHILLTISNRSCSISLLWGGVRNALKTLKIWHTVTKKNQRNIFWLTHLMHKKWFSKWPPQKHSRNLQTDY